MTPFLPLLSLAIGLSWADFMSVYSTTARLSGARVMKATIASSLLVNALALLFVHREIGWSLLFALVAVGIGLLVGRRIPSTMSLACAALSLAVYVGGTVH